MTPSEEKRRLLFLFVWLLWVFLFRAGDVWALGVSELPFRGVTRAETSDPRWPRLRRWGSRGCLMPPVGLVVLVGVWGLRGFAQGMLEVNRSERKRGSADAGLFHWTMSRKYTFEWFLDSGFQILSARGLSNKTLSESIVKWAAFPRGWRRDGIQGGFILQDTHTDATVTCHVFKSHLSIGCCHKLRPLAKAGVPVWPPARAAMQTIHLECAHEKCIVNKKIIPVSLSCFRVKGNFCPCIDFLRLKTTPNFKTSAVFSLSACRVHFIFVNCKKMRNNIKSSPSLISRILSFCVSVVFYHSSSLS